VTNRDRPNDKEQAMAEHVPAYVREHGPLETALRVVGFANEIASLKDEPTWQRGERVARTLTKEGRLRIALVLMRQGSRLHEHKTEGATTIQCLEGRMRLLSLGREIELLPGELVALDGGVPHSAEAVSECAFLVTIAQ
jgi:quercetin dioxygenase-like cupin family protein